jgi:hypothetical protein
MIEKLHDAGLRSEYAYIAGFASIGLSFWPGRRRGGPRRRARTGPTGGGSSSGAWSRT